MNGEVCCILGVCCPPASAEQRDALATSLKTSHPHLADAHCADVAGWVLEHFDLAPAGSLTHLKSAIATMAKQSK